MVKYKLFVFVMMVCVGSLYGQSTYHFEKSFAVVFPNDIGGQVSYIEFPATNFAGIINITISSGFTYQLSVGVLKKRIAIMKGSSYFNQFPEVMDVSGPLSTQWSIGDYDEVNNRVPIYHLSTKGNTISVKIDGQIHTAGVAGQFQNNLAVTAPVVVTNAQTRQYKAIMQDRVGIGTATPTERLSVNGNIRAKEIKVEVTNWPDYVFKPEYPLAPLSEVEDYIKTHGHLPGIPDAAEVQDEGVGLSALNRTLLEKIEELTLHLIENEKEKKQMAEDIGILKVKMEELSKQR